MALTPATKRDNLTLTKDNTQTKYTGGSSTQVETQVRKETRVKKTKTRPKKKGSIFKLTVNKPNQRPGLQSKSCTIRSIKM